MIRYALRCARGHGFDSWFRSAAAFDALQASGQLSCAVCDDARISKAPMAPSVPARPEMDGTPRAAMLDAPASEAEARMQALRAHLESNSDYVGDRFADEARAMHEGRSDARAIHGEARLTEAAKLIEDGVPIAPLPFMRRRKLS